ncbi:hypothetical protein PFISCL1PPCAC_12128, partial [Pristionchus fissidentatus]
MESAVATSDFWIFSGKDGGVDTVVSELLHDKKYFFLTMKRRYSGEKIPEDKLPDPKSGFDGFLSIISRLFRRAFIACLDLTKFDFKTLHSSEMRSNLEKLKIFIHVKALNIFLKAKNYCERGFFDFISIIRSSELWLIFDYPIDWKLIEKLPPYQSLRVKSRTEEDKFVDDSMFIALLR